MCIRDSLYTRYNQFGFEFDLIDTAGIRKKSKVSEDIEFYSILRSVRAIENSDICLVIFDIERGFDSQVQNIFWLAARNKKGIVVLVNKWDIAEKDHTTTKSIEEEIIGKTSPFTDIPIVFISALTKLHIFFVLHTLNRLQLLAFLFRQSVSKTGPSIASISSLIDILSRPFFNL